MEAVLKAVLALLPPIVVYTMWGGTYEPAIRDWIAFKSLLLAYK